jgi:hypothetical protein
MAALLMPKARAWNMPQGTDVLYISETGDYYVGDTGTYGYVSTSSDAGIMSRYQLAIAGVYAQSYEDAVGVMDALLPDNDNFTTDDATRWERALGIYRVTGTSLSDRKLAIMQKLTYPVGNVYVQHYLFIQEQLRAAGFDVYVYENRFDDGMGGYITKTPAQIIGVTPDDAIFGNIQFGQVQFGSGYHNKIVQYIEEDKDAGFSIGNWRTTFYVAGSDITTFADIPTARKDEFRQLLISIKQIEMVGFLFVNYV